MPFLEDANTLHYQIFFLCCKSVHAKIKQEISNCCYFGLEMCNHFLKLFASPIYDTHMLLSISVTLLYL